MSDAELMLLVKAEAAAVRLDYRWLLLDNTAFVLVPDHERTDYRPLIAFGAEADLTTVETALVDVRRPARCGAR